MYYIGLLRNLFKWSNVGVFIFFFLNMGVVISLYVGMGQSSIAPVLIIYCCSLIISMSPIGDWLLATFAGAKNLARTDMRMRIEPILRRVHEKALEKTPNMQKTINLKIIYDSAPNAFAIGKKNYMHYGGAFKVVR